MNNSPNTLWLIIDVSGFTYNVKPFIKQIINENNLDTKLVNIALEYCLTISIYESMFLPVVFTRDSYLENIFYNRLKDLCDKNTFNLINKNYLNMFLNQEVKLLFTGNNLFLTTFQEI